MPEILAADGAGNAGWKLGVASRGGVGTIIGLGGRLWCTAAGEDTGMFCGERSNTAAGGGDGEMAWRIELPWASGGDFEMRQLVRVADAQAVAVGVVSSSDSVKSITLMSPLAVHAAVEVVVVVVVVLVVVAAAEAFDRGVSTTHIRRNYS